jgi:glycosyltransferase involved in cell wall biosynthesis
MKIYILLLNVNSIGGIERVAKNLHSTLSLYKAGVDVEIFDIPKLKIKYGSCSELLLCYRFMRDKSQEDIVLSLYDRLSINLLLAKIFNFMVGPKVVACQHADFYANKIHTRILRSFFYKKVNHIVCITSADKKLYIESGMKNISTIPNPIIYYPSTVEPFSSRANNVVAAGRLNKVKSFERFIDLAKMMSNSKGITFSLYGDGEERERLIRYASTLELDSQKILCGVSSRLDDVFGMSKFLIVTSKRESFSMVILESMASGCIPISFDCPTGPRELIDHGVNGFLVPPGDVSGIKKIIDMLLDKIDLAERISRNARIKASLYKRENVLAMWRNVLNEL